MAKAERPKEAEDEAEAPAKPKKNSSKLIIIAIISVVVLALAGGGAFFLLGGKNKPGTEGGEQAAAEKQQGDEETTGDEEGDQTAGGKTSPAQPPVYIKLEAFTTNLAPEEGVAFGATGQYIQLVVELKADNAPSGETLKLYTPEIRNNILRLLSNKRPSQLASLEGKDTLANEIRDSVNGIVNPGGNKEGKGPYSPVVSVLFSSFIIQ